MFFLLSGLLNTMFWNQNTMVYYMEILIEDFLEQIVEKKLGGKI